MQTETIGKQKLMNLLTQIDKKLETKIRLNAAGGTALTLIDLKDSTKDIDFDLNKEDAEEFRKTINKIPHGFRIDIFEDGMIFSQQLEDDYEQKAIHIKSFKNIELFALHPIDIVASKIGRLNERDIQDIKTCIKKFKLTKKQVNQRAEKIEYVGHEETYNTNLRYVLKEFFK